MDKPQDIFQYNESQLPADKEICHLLSEIISAHLPEAENKIWHAHPVWFLDGNPIVGYSKQKAGIRLMFWSGADFGEPLLLAGTGKFRDASVFFNSVDEITKDSIIRFLEKSRKIQWDYKNIVKRKGQLERLTDF
jgi:hypothetical protein